MNRTILYASRHATDALRPGIRLSSCLSCMARRNHSERVQYHLLRRLPVEAPSSASTSIRLLSTKRTKKPKGPKLLSPKKERFKQYPLLEGEQQPAISRPSNEIQNERREQRYKERVTIEQQRISSIVDKPLKPKSESDSSAEKRFSSARPPRTQPSPAQKGVYSPGTSNNPIPVLTFRFPCSEKENQETSSRPPENTKEKRQSNLHQCFVTLKELCPPYSWKGLTLRLP
jgi:hypothetical protein